jgi:general transcription factor 3C polypeptide 1
MQSTSYINNSLFQVIRCLRLLKKFNPNEFKRESTASNFKLGNKCLVTDQFMELPLENSIYEMIHAEGPKGATLVEVPLRTFQQYNLMCGALFQ